MNFERAGDRRRIAVEMMFTAVLAVALIHPFALSAGTPSPPPSTSAAASHNHPGIRIAHRSPISAAADRLSVAPGATIVVRGQVVTARRGPGTRRGVRLWERTASKWAPLTRATTTANGTFQFTVAAGTTRGERAFRVVAPLLRAPGRAQPFPAVHTRRIRVLVEDKAPTQPTATPTVEPTTTPTTAPTDVLDLSNPPVETPAGDWDPAEYPHPHTPTPTGDANDWWYLVGPGGIRWNPCQTIRWSYNPTGAYPGSQADMQRTFARIAGLTGLHFKYVGATATTPRAGAGGFPTGIDLAVGWSDAAQDGDLEGNALAYAITAATASPGKDVAHRITQATVVLDRDEVLVPGHSTTGPVTWGQVMTHEALHALGLGHAVSAAQVMAPIVTTRNHLFGAGDLTGMRAIGATHGCL